MKNKICSCCKETFEATEKNFRKKKGKYKYGLYSQCRDCEDNYNKEFRKKHKVRLAAKAVEHKNKLKSLGLCTQCGGRS